MAKCSNCGARYNKQETADRILDYCMIYSESDFGDLCFDCAVEKFINDTGEDPAHFHEDDYDEEDVSDVGCIACGNPAYPKCKTSCPLFDD